MYHCMGGSKGKAGIQVKRITEKKDTTEMHPGKVIILIYYYAHNWYIILIEVCCLH